MLHVLKRLYSLVIFLWFGYYWLSYETSSSFLDFNAVQGYLGYLDYVSRYIVSWLMFLFGKLAYLVLLSTLIAIFVDVGYDYLLISLFAFGVIGEFALPKYALFGAVSSWLHNARSLLGYYTIYEVLFVYLPLALFGLIKAWKVQFAFIKKIFKVIWKSSSKVFNFLFSTQSLITRLSRVDRKEVKKKVEKPAVQAGNLPPLSLLQVSPGHKQQNWNASARQAQLEQVLLEFGVKGKIVKSSVGPIVTLYELQPEPGVKAVRIIGLANDIARSMSTLSARIATIPGRDVIGIELANPQRETVYLSDILASNEYRNSKNLLLGLGCDIAGEPVIANLALMPHMLMAGTTGSGKSVVIHTILLSLLFNHSPETCRLILIDPKMLELSSYADIPHLLTPVVTDSKIAIVALKWAVQEMERRYKVMAAAGVRNLDAYNAKTKTKLPYIVVIVDEFADLMLVAGKDIDTAIQRLAQMARAAGIHVILATQRPSVDVITGTIKANFPTRLALHVASRIDGRTVLGDYGGAEQLLGKGDMLYLNGGKLRRVHGPFVSAEEVEAVVDFWKKTGQPNYEEIDLVGFEEEEELGGGDEMLDKILNFMRQSGRISISAVQREFSIGFNKAAKYIETLEKKGKVSSPDSMGRRKLL